MTFPYDYDCDCDFDNERGYKGRQSDVLFNGERHNVYEAVKHLIDYPSSATATPVAKHRGALWLDQRTNQLYVWVGLGYKHDRVRDGWLPVFADKFQVFDEMMNDLPSSSPVLGQLWLYNGVLMYFDGSDWQPVKALEQSDSQFNISAFADFQIYSPLSKIGSAVISDLELEAYLELQRRYQNADSNLSDRPNVSISERWNIDDYAGRSSTNGTTESNSQTEGYETPIIHESVIDFNLEDVSYQYLVPNMDVDRVFVDHKLDTNYVQQSRSVIQYKRSYLLDEEPNYNDDTPATSHVKRPTLIHMNPGKLSDIKKRLFKIDRDNPKIMCPAYHTEFYGFKVGDIHGRLLIPTKEVDKELYEYQKLLATTSEANKAALKQKLSEMGYELDSLYASDIRDKTGDYEKQSDGIYLSSEAALQYDYVLAITYEFSWINSTGQLRQGDNRSGNSSYYIPQKLGTMNVFVNGFDYEDTYFSWDPKNETVTLAEDIKDREDMDVSVLGVFAHEYGFIRSMNIASDNKSARISSVHRFLRPLIFVNGEVLCRSSWSYFDKTTLSDTERPGTTFTLYGVHRDMCWTIIDMQREEIEYDENGIQVSSTLTDICIEDDGIVDKTDDFVDSHGNRAIPLPEGYEITYEDSDNYVYKRPRVVLFVNGLMVKREDVYYDIASRTITCEGLMPGMTYVLLDDTLNNLYTEEMEDGVLPALSVGKIDESLVYHNGYLLNESSSYRYEGEQGFAATSAMHGEIKAFNGGTEWKVFNAENRDTHRGIPGTWENAPEGMADEVRSFSNSYTNATTSISLADNVPNTLEDEIIIFGYKLANYIESPTTPVTCWLHQNMTGEVFVKEYGYAEEYIELIKSENDSAVCINKIDPTNPDVISRYMERNNLYYLFCFHAFDLWSQETSIRNRTNLTLREMIQEYKKDSKLHPDDYANRLKGYFYDGVYMRTKSDEYTYIDLRDSARGVLWSNKAFIGKDYDPEKDYVMVWLNGVRQYPGKNYVIEPLYQGEAKILKGYNIVFGHYEGETLVRSIDDNGYIKVERGEGNTIANGNDTEPVTGMLTYIIQKPENGASVACRYTILDDSNCLDGSQNVYTTKDLDNKYIDTISFTRDTSHDFQLYPGKVTLYADGVRLPKSAYTVLDNYTIVINSDKQFIGSKSNYPNQKCLNVYGNIETIRHLRPEEILVEVRKESTWVERTMSTDSTFSGDINVLTDSSSLPVTILDTQDTIMMFIDGIYYGLTQNDGYVIDKTLSMISIRDATVLNAMRKNDIEIWLAQHPELESVYGNELVAYRARHKNGHELTIEWR